MLEPEIFDVTSENPNTSSVCTFTEPKSLITGCIEGVGQGVGGDPAAGIVAGGIVVGQGVKSVLEGVNPVVPMLQAARVETVASCAYGVINTALENCQASIAANINQPIVTDASNSSTEINQVAPVEDQLASHTPPIEPSTDTSNIADFTPLDPLPAVKLIGE